MLLAWNTHSVFSHTSVCSFHGLRIGDTSHHSGQMKLSERTQSPLAASFVLLLKARSCVRHKHQECGAQTTLSPACKKCGFLFHTLDGLCVHSKVYLLCKTKQNKKNVSS